MIDIYNVIKTSTYSLEELNLLAELVEQKKAELNPYANLKSMSNKKFGEEFSETLLCEKVGGFTETMV